MIVVFPLCGSGERFKEAGYAQWKPLIPVRGKPMLQWAAERVGAVRPDEIIAAVPAMLSKDTSGQIADVLNKTFPETAVRLLPIATPTAGAAETVKIAAAYATKYPANMDRPFVIVDCDDTHDSLQEGTIRANEAGVAVFDVDPIEHTPLNRWGYIVGGDGATATIEKPNDKWLDLNRADLPPALAGVFWWPSALTYLYAYERMRETQTPTRGEWYVSQVVQATIDGGIPAQAIIDGGTPVRVVPVTNFHCLGTPADVAAFDPKAHA